MTKANDTLRKRLHTISLLGEGKDGVSTRITRNGVDVVSKALTPYAKSWLFMVRAYIDAGVESKHLSAVRIVENRLEYDFEPLTHISHDVTHKYFEQIITLEQDLLKHNLLFWDFGGVRGYERNNYMKNKEGVVRWIDYGGNGILCLDKDRGPKLKQIMYDTPKISDRNCLVYPSNDFIRLAILFHACLSVEVNTQKMVSLGTAMQRDPSTHKAAYAFFLSKLKNTCWKRLALNLKEIDVGTIEGWEDMRDLL